MTSMASASPRENGCVAARAYDGRDRLGVTPIAIVTTPTTEKEGRCFAAPDTGLGDPRSGTVRWACQRTSRRQRASTPWFMRSKPIQAGTRRTRCRINWHARRSPCFSVNVRTVCVDGANLEARSQMLLGAMLAGMAFANSPVAAVHALGVSDRRDLSRAPWPVERAGADPGTAVQLPEAEALYAELAPSSIPSTEGLSVSQKGAAVRRRHRRDLQGTARCRRRLQMSALPRAT